MQLAKYLGTRVTAACRTKYVELVGRSAPTRCSTTRSEEIVEASRYVETEQKTVNVALTVSGDRSVGDASARASP